MKAGLKIQWCGVTLILVAVISTLLVTLIVPAILFGWSRVWCFYNFILESAPVFVVGCFTAAMIWAEIAGYLNRRKKSWEKW